MARSDTESCDNYASSALNLLNLSRKACRCNYVIAIFPLRPSASSEGLFLRQKFAE